MEKKYQVFISSTYSDLQNERMQLIQALLELNCIPTGMELFQAANDDQWTYIKRIIDNCDYFIVIIAGRYGTIHPTTNLSYTEMEYRYALERHIPTIGFLHKNPNNIPLEKSDREKSIVKKLFQFRELVSQKLISYWENPYELNALVSRSMMNLIKNSPAIGWIKANEVAQFIQDTKIQDSDGNISNEIMRDTFFDAVNQKVKTVGYYISVSSIYSDDKTIYTLTPLDEAKSEIEYIFIDNDTYKNFFITPDIYKPQYIDNEILNKSFGTPNDDAFKEFFSSFISKRLYEHFDIIDRIASSYTSDSDGKTISMGVTCESLNKKIGKYNKFYENDKILKREDIEVLFRLPHLKRGKFCFDKIDETITKWISQQ